MAGDVDAGSEAREPASELLTQASEAYGWVVADSERAADRVSSLLDEAQRAGDQRALAAALRAAGWLQRSRYAHDRAIALLDEAVRLSRRHGLQPQWRHALTTRGAVRQELGDLAGAQRDFSAAARFLDASGESDVDLEHQQATLHQNVGRIDLAAVAYRRILNDPGAPPDMRTKASNNLGIIEIMSGRMDAGLAMLDAAVEEAEAVGPRLAAYFHETRAWGTVRAGRLAEGLVLFDDAAARWTSAGIPLGELYVEYAEALTDLRLIPEARREARRAVAMLDVSGVALMTAEAQVRSAQLALLAGDLRAASEEADAAAAALRRQGRGSWAARARVVAIDAVLAAQQATAQDLRTARRAAGTLERAGLVGEAVDAFLTAGRVADALDRPVVARDSWDRAAELARGAPLLVRLKGRVAAGLSAASAGRPGVVLQVGGAGLADLAGHRAALPSAELRALASGHGAELGHLGLAAVATSRPPADVLRWMERTRAAALAVVDPPEVEGVEAQLGNLRAVQAEIAQARMTGSGELAELLVRQTALEEEIRRATWRQLAVGDAEDRPRSISELRRELGGRTLVEYDVLGDDVIAVVLAPRATRLVRLGPVATVRRELDGLSFGLRRLARAVAASSSVVREGAEESLTALRAQLVEPLRLGACPEVVVVPVGVLQRVPWTALHDVAVAVAPSAAMWARTNARPAPADRRVVLIAGPELPGAVAEVEAVAALHADDAPRVLVPPASDIAAVTAALADATLAHIACHGLVRADNPIFSSLLVSDGRLSVHELDRRGISPHRLVLAACESGSEGTYPGNETLGFVSTLLALGTSGLLASSVVVPDWNVVELMTSLHTALRGGATMPVALHEARAAIDRDDPAGFVSWCAFDAFGAA